MSRRCDGWSIRGLVRATHHFDVNSCVAYLKIVPDFSAPQQLAKSIKYDLMVMA